MKKSAAFKLYLLGNPRALKIFNRIMAWNPKLSCRQNADRMNGVSGVNASIFAKRYKLKYIPGRTGYFDPKLGFWKFHPVKKNGEKK